MSRRNGDVKGGSGERALKSAVANYHHKQLASANRRKEKRKTEKHKQRYVAHIDLGQRLGGETPQHSKTFSRAQNCEVCESIQH
jgi:hypothetical protein